jgi:hypothetical protein
MHIDDVNGPWQVECNCDAPPVQGPSFLGAEAEFAMHQAEAIEAVLFSDQAIERAASALAWTHLRSGGKPDSYIRLDANATHAAIKIVITALKGDA